MKYEFELCKGRHATPATEAIFPMEVDPTDTGALFAIAEERIPRDATEIVVYVTGMTPAMLAVVEVCWKWGITLTAMHYNRDSGEYFPQCVLLYGRCAFCGKPYSVWDWACPHCGAT